MSLDFFWRAFGRVQFFVGCLRVVQDPYNTDLIIRSAQRFVTPERYQPTREFQASLPGGRELLADRPPVKLPTIGELGEFPLGTLGREYAEHMVRNGLDPDFFDVPFHDDVTYGFYRYGKVHDLWHVITGFSTEVEGELGILTFSYAQLRGPGLILIAGLGLIHCVIFRPFELNRCVTEFFRGYQMGLKADPLLAVEWQEFLAWPLSEVRSHFRISAETQFEMPEPISTLNAPPSL